MIISIIHFTYEDLYEIFHRYRLYAHITSCSPKRHFKRCSLYGRQPQH